MSQMSWRKLCRYELESKGFRRVYLPYTVETMDMQYKNKIKTHHKVIHI